LSDSIDYKFIKFFLFGSYGFVIQNGVAQESIVVVISSEKLEWLPDLISVNFMIKHDLTSEPLFFDGADGLVLVFWIFGVDQI
jgi:hypothetical protein